MSGWNGNDKEIEKVKIIFLDHCYRNGDGLSIMGRRVYPIDKEKVGSLLVKDFWIVGVSLSVGANPWEEFLF